MGPKTRILDATMLVFRRHGFRRSSIEQVAEAAGLTRQALYHHFESKEALFRAVIERVHESAIAAEETAVAAAETAGGDLGDILAAGMTARMSTMIGSLDGSPHLEELYSEHLVHARDLYQTYAARYAERMVATISRIVRKQQLALPQDLSPAEFARLVEMAMYAAKSQYPAMQPSDAFLKDMAIMVRTLCAGALPKSQKPPVKKAAIPKRPTRRTSGGHP
ncbi:TetR/AcrR family transcriptional regulator [Bradyrhizobium brasilense]|uniref:Transcriptional regulator, TetR family n=1 Tax=Bradyrhizobium brasilense TaxID=1419277 RepID=A0A1G7FJQ7_9BRAD|nr:TetR/AcrR family transcriptional regulator [Bradyrhizobium brasilense]MCC8971366.1 TetR/AcrR family transcriptional regulator [Bradyrhizobium brasilense]SDE76146.1 transcriptional regulator, TetR family [Bradyrhizobium brasilense]